jgi:two-component system sensor histidine kinase KdpD
MTRTPPRLSLDDFDWNGIGWAVALVAAATAVGWPLHRTLGVADTNILMLYLLGVLWIATHHSRGAAVVASVLGVAAFDFTFVLPYYRFTVHDPQYLVTFAVMLTTALLISELTHRMRAQSEAAKVAWQRVETEFLRNTLLSGVSHELRTPLAAITGAASTLVETGDDLSPDARREMLDTVCSEAERMERLINNLLDMTRLESKGLVVKKEWQPLQEVIGSALHRLERRMHGRRITTAVSADLPLVHIDSVLMEQVLMNLLDNALQYTPAGAAIDISARAVDGLVEVDVADHGPGLPPGTEERVFQKFFRYHPRETRGRGIGLGLAICRAIVEAHGGKITAANRPGGGAVFHLTLPQHQIPPVVDATG